ncbi:MAG: metallophosphoesterase [Planctomycetota bacterium]|nr:metallophosphoesterase [Planctomycetota bacterium]
MPTSPRQRLLRLAHITDVHVQPERGAAEGFAACLRHIQSLPDPPTLILNGGDAVMDVSAADAARAAALGDLWRSVLRAECSLPIEHCLGNHDFWGTHPKSTGLTGREPLWGKAWALDLFGLDRRYRAFDRAGWRFILLDSTFHLASCKVHGYTAKLDDEQFAWLESTLAATPAGMPIVVLSHIPIITVTAYFDGDNESTGDWAVPGAWMHIDARRIKDLFRKHPNVKLCLSGHIHLADRVDYEGVTYLCNGAVCGSWWKGPYQGCPAGYGLIDLYADGGFEHRYVDYGWTARET